MTKNLEEGRNNDNWHGARQELVVNENELGKVGGGGGGNSN